MTFAFRYTYGTKFEIIDTVFANLDFYNLSNRATGPRRYGYTAHIVRAVNPEGEVAFRAQYQTTLDGVRYQSSKYSRWAATGAEAHDLLAKTIVGAHKRYAKLALDPASRIERRAA